MPTGFLSLAGAFVQISFFHFCHVLMVFCIGGAIFKEMSVHKIMIFFKNQFYFKWLNEFLNIASACSINLWNRPCQSFKQLTPVLRFAL